jgi:hypothetical protein
MNLKLVPLTLAIAAVALAAAPAFAQGQMAPPPKGGQMAPPPKGGQMAPPPQAQAPKPTKAQVQALVQGITADKAKLTAYCTMSKINMQMGSLDEKKDANKLQDLGQQADAQAQKLGPDFEKVMDGLEQVDENSAEGKEYAAILDGLDKQCK